MRYVEKPDDKELKALYKKYHKPKIRKMVFDLSKYTEKLDYPPCKGEGFSIIHENNKFIMIKTKNKRINSWSFPKGRIWGDESIEEGTIREAKEETGYDVVLGSLVEIQKRIYVFKNLQLERWRFIFLARIIGSDMSPIDLDEICDIKFFTELPPEWKSEEWMSEILVKSRIIS